MVSRKSSSKKRSSARRSSARRSKKCVYSTVTKRCRVAKKSKVAGRKRNAWNSFVKKNAGKAKFRGMPAGERLHRLATEYKKKAKKTSKRRSKRMSSRR